MSFDPSVFFGHRIGGHGSRLGIDYVTHGDDWSELSLPYDPALIGDPETGVIASGPIVALMDMAMSVGAWLRQGRFTNQATLDMRVDYLRPAAPGRTVIGRGECYRLTRSIAFVRGSGA